MADKQIPPLVSVLLPVFNGESYLAAAVESVLAQTFQSFELIIVNDGSSDTSAEIIQSYKDQRICYLHMPTNVGLVGALNAGLALVRGKYVARIDADDKWFPDKLTRQVQLLSKQPEIALCGTWYTQIDTDDRIIRNVELPVSPEENYIQLFERNTFVHSGVMFKSGIVRSLGGYDPSWQHIEDYALWLALAARYPVCNLPESLFYYRLHESSISSLNFIRQQKKVLALRRVALQHCGIAISDRLLAEISRGRVSPSLADGLRLVHRGICEHAPACLNHHKLVSVCQQLEESYLSGIASAVTDLLAEIWRKRMGRRIAFYAGGSLADSFLDGLEALKFPFPNVIFDKFPERTQIKRVKVDKIENLPAYDIQIILITHEQLHSELYQRLTSMDICQGVEIIDPWQGRQTDQ